MKGSISSTPRTSYHPCMGRRYEPPSYLTHANTLNMITPDFNDIPPGSRPRIVTTASAITSRIGIERFGTRKNKSHKIKIGKWDFIIGNWNTGTLQRSGKKLYGLFLWVCYNCLKATEPPRGDSLLFTSQNSNVNCSAILGTLSVLHEL